MLGSCCCFRLRTGTLIIGALNVIGAIFFAIIWGFSFTNVYEVKDSDAKDVAFIVLYIALSIIVANLIGGIILLIGTLKKRHSLLLTWLIFAGIGIILDVISTVASISTKEPLQLIEKFIALGLGSYFWCVVYSHFKELKEINGKPSYMPQIDI